MVSHEHPIVINIEKIFESINITADGDCKNCKARIEEVVFSMINEFTEKSNQLLSDVLLRVCDSSPAETSPCSSEVAHDNGGSAVHQAPNSKH